MRSLLVDADRSKRECCSLASHVVAALSQELATDPTKTRPGTYQFTTRPPVCTATFTVTSTAPNAPDTPGTLPFTGSHTPMLLTIGSGLLVAGVGLVLVVRRQARLAS